ncbi:hypothetical protein DKM19_22500 [Streptosporangium sp. 'caverna']|nr:hypothetical protein DKM19_22500 [Streptosporangium sp. 'caverna']
MVTALEESGATRYFASSLKVAGFLPPVATSRSYVVCCAARSRMPAGWGRAFMVLISMGAGGVRPAVTVLSFGGSANERAGEWEVIC